MERQLLNISKPAANKARIEIDGTIGGFDWDEWKSKNTGTDIRKQLKEISALNVDEIEVLITSLGGYVDDALQIHDALKEHPAKVTTIVQGCCASAATIIACAGDVRIISPNALYLIHKCIGWADGNENDLQEELEAQRTTNEVILKIYKGVLKKDEKELLDLFNANNGRGKWITAEEALAFGFATDIQEFANDKPAKSMARFLNHARDYFPVLNQIINPNTNQNQPAMKKYFLATFAMLGALLSMKADDEYDEKDGRQLTVDQLQSIEDTLKEFEALKAKNTETENELAGVKAALATAESKIEAKDSEITTLTADRDKWKAKYENAPAPVQNVNGNDANGEPVDVTDNPLYDELEKLI